MRGGGERERPGYLTGSLNRQPSTTNLQVFVVAHLDGGLRGSGSESEKHRVTGCDRVVRESVKRVVRESSRESSEHRDGGLRQRRRGWQRGKRRAAGSGQRAAGNGQRAAGSRRVRFRRPDGNMDGCRRGSRTDPFSGCCLEDGMGGGVGNQQQPHPFASIQCDRTVCLALRRVQVPGRVQYMTSV